MKKKLLFISLIFLSLGSSAIVVTDEYLDTIEENWLSLEPADAYDFIPEDLTYETYMSWQQLEPDWTTLSKVKISLLLALWFQ